ncbi:MAG: DNA cytosine methyltransferase [Arcanobacterium sp.]|uniref:DNA cytosine methyltransferase n=1 Tax=Trueperella pyogenes TaxID=1661 RepID=UPI002A9CA9CB|nr:DNA cytosine methyltransferase [Arcanobacterium sp.]MDY5854483.1 DNA cytosine methyltransferase [Arcanobacterium sp.]
MTENQNIPDRLLSPEDASKELKISPQRVRQLIANGTLVAERVGRSWVIRNQDLEAARPAITTSVIPAKTASLGEGNLKALSFFSGAMGLDLGLERAGIDTILACEFDKWARQTISTNRPDLPVLGDIWRYDADEILDLAGTDSAQQIDVMAGGPPCQAFSTAGARRGFDDLRGNVFLHYLDLIEKIKPKYAVIENVRGLLSLPVSPTQSEALLETTGVDFSQKHGAIRLVTHRLREAGYKVSFNLYNAANFGTPQIRERVVIIATLADKKVPYLLPSNSDDPSFKLPSWNTLRDAIEDLDDSDSEFIPFPEKRLQYFRMLKPGQYWKDLPADIQPIAMGKSFHLGGGKTGFYRRLAWDRPSPTLVTHPAMPATDLGHPEKDRPLTVAEYKRIQQFPDDWIIEGRPQQQYKQIGNAVPLGLGEAIGQAIVAHSKGISAEPPKNFRYSRYRNTSDLELCPLLDDTNPDTLF